MDFLTDLTALLCFVIPILAYWALIGVLLESPEEKQKKKRKRVE